jgi:MYXO-CTERM domain-containing protein
MSPVRLRGFGLVFVTALLVLSPMASAQSFSVDVEPQEPVNSLEEGDQVSVDVLVRLQGEDFNCLENHEFPVLVEANDTEGVTGTPSADELAFSNTQGVHTKDSPDGTYNQSKTVSVTIGAPASLEEDRVVEVPVVGTFPGGNYGPPDATCGPESEFPEASGQTDVIVPLDAPEPKTSPADDTPDDTQDETTRTEDGEQTNDSPVGVWVALAAVGLALVVRRRR